MVVMLNPILMPLKKKMSKNNIATFNFVEQNTKEDSKDGQNA